MERDGGAELARLITLVAGGGARRLRERPASTARGENPADEASAAPRGAWKVHFWDDIFWPFTASAFIAMVGLFLIGDA
jgi:hypothetical protein